MKHVDIDDQIAISDLLTEFYWRLDHGGGAHLAELFTPQGKFILPRRRFESPIEFEHWAVERASDKSFVSRHIWSNLRLTAIDEHSVRAEGNVIIFQQRNARATLIIGNFTDRVEKGAWSGWRFVERRAHVVFEGALVAGIPN